MKSFKITALSLDLVLLLAACGAKNDTPDEPAVDPTPEPPIEQPVEKTPDERINDIIAGMSLEEKVGQLFFVRCPETGAAEDVETYHLGGLLLFGRGIARVGIFLCVGNISGRRGHGCVVARGTAG